MKYQPQGGALQGVGRGAKTIPARSVRCLINIIMHDLNYFSDGYYDLNYYDNGPHRHWHDYNIIIYVFSLHFGTETGMPSFVVEHVFNA